MALAKISGHRVHYLDQGQGGPALVLLHAFPLRAAMWSPQLDALSTTTRVVAPDLLGFGTTDAPDDPSAYSVDIWADQVSGLLDHLGLERVIVGGLSMGGYAALAFARRHRGRLAGLVLADTRPGPDTAEAAERRRNQIRQLHERESAELVETLLGGLLGSDTRRHRPDVVAATRALMDSSPAGFIGALEAMIRRPDSAPVLADFDVPTLVMVGEQDVLSPPEVARALHAAVPGAVLAVIPGAGHLSSLEAPAAFNAALVNFVGRCQEASEQR